METTPPREKTKLGYLAGLLWIVLSCTIVAVGIHKDAQASWHDNGLLEHSYVFAPSLLGAGALAAYIFRSRFTVKGRDLASGAFVGLVLLGVLSFIAALSALAAPGGWQ